MTGPFEEKKPTYTLYSCPGFCTTNQVKIIITSRLRIINKDIISVFFITDISIIVSQFFQPAFHRR